MMRFEQLKHDPNTIAEKMRYKSAKKWVCVSGIALLSGLILFSTDGNITQVNSASVSDTSSVATNDVKYKSGNTYGVDWNLYAINGDNNNLRLEIGDPNKSEEFDRSIGSNLWEDYAKNISTITFVGKVKGSDSQMNLFDGDSKLTSINGLDKFDTSQTFFFNNMFADDPMLTHLDISSLDMSNNGLSTDMFSNSGIQSLVLGPKTVLGSDSITGQPHYFSDGTKYEFKDWTSSDDASSKPISTTDLLSKYARGITHSGSTTWTAANPTKLSRYYIEYVDADNPDKVIYPTGSDISNVDMKYVPEGTTISGIKPLSKLNRYVKGYSADTIENDSGGIEKVDGSNVGVVKAKVKPLADVKMSVTIHDGDDAPIDESFNIPVNDPDYEYKSIKAPSNATLDLRNSYVIYYSGRYPLDYFKKYHYVESSDIDSIIKYLISEINFNKNVAVPGKTGETVEKRIFLDKDAGQTKANFDLFYKKNSTGGGSSHHNGSSNNGSNTNNSVNSGTSTKIKQTVGTTTKVVNVYDKKGKLITNRALGKNTGWLSDQEYKLNGTLYYRVATDEYVKASDVYVYVADKRTVHVHNNQLGYLVDYKGDKITNRALKSDTDWITDKYTIINGQKYYRVATNEFVSAADVSLI